MAPRSRSKKLSKKSKTLKKAILIEDTEDRKAYDEEINTQIFGDRLPSSIPYITIQTEGGETKIPSNLPDGTVITIPGARVPDAIPQVQPPTPQAPPSVPQTPPTPQAPPSVPQTPPTPQPAPTVPIISNIPIIGPIVDAVIEVVRPTEPLRNTPVVRNPLAITQYDINIFKGVAISSMGPGIPSVGAMYNPMNVRSSCNTSGSSLREEDGRTVCGFTDMFIWDQSVETWHPRLVIEAHQKNSFLWNTVHMQTGLSTPSRTDILAGVKRSKDYSVYVDQLLISRIGMWRVSSPGINVNLADVEKRLDYIERSSNDIHTPESFADFVNRNLYPIVYISFHSFNLPQARSAPQSMITAQIVPPTQTQFNTPYVNMGRIPRNIIVTPPLQPINRVQFGPPRPLQPPPPPSGINPETGIPHGQPPPPPTINPETGIPHGQPPPPPPSNINPETGIPHGQPPPPPTQAPLLSPVPYSPENPPPPPSQPSVSAKDHPKYSTYFKMIQRGIPLGAVLQKMAREGVDHTILDNPDEMFPLTDEIQQSIPTPPQPPAPTSRRQHLVDNSSESTAQDNLDFMQQQADAVQREQDSRPQPPSSSPPGQALPSGIMAGIVGGVRLRSTSTPTSTVEQVQQLPPIQPPTQSAEQNSMIDRFSNNQQVPQEQEHDVDANEWED